MATARPLFTLPARTVRTAPNLCNSYRHKLRHSHAGFAHKQRDPRPLSHVPPKTTKPGERQLRATEKHSFYKSQSQSGAFKQPPLPVSAPTVQEKTPSEPYFVRRTPTRNLPVYQEAKRGGNLKQTRIRKIEGDGQELVKQLDERLEPRPEWIRLNPVNQHVEMKGWYKGQIDELLVSKGF